MPELFVGAFTSRKDDYIRVLGLAQNATFADIGREQSIRYLHFKACELGVPYSALATNP